MASIPAFNTRPGCVVEAEILHHFGSTINGDPASKAKAFFLVLSVGHCKFCLSIHLVEHLLQAILGGFRKAFQDVQLADRVFRFSVATQLVGFHIFNLRSFECADFKVFFHLWHDGRPNYQIEYHNWCLQQDSKWETVTKRKTVCLSSANSVPIHGHRRLHSSSNAMNFSNSNLAFIPVRKSVFMRINHGLILPINDKVVSVSVAGILRLIPNPNHIALGHRPLIQLCTKCLSLAHSRPVCNDTMRCWRCLRPRHVFGLCRLPPR